MAMTYTKSLWTTVAALIGFGLGGVIILVQRHASHTELLEATTGELLSRETTCAIRYHDAGRWKRDQVSDEMACETARTTSQGMAFNQGPSIIYIDRLAFKYWSRRDGHFHEGHDLRVGQFQLQLPAHAKIRVLFHTQSGNATFDGLVKD